MAGESRGVILVLLAFPVFLRRHNRLLLRETPRPGILVKQPSGR